MRRESLFGLNWLVLGGYGGDPWFVWEDFNIVRFPREKRNCSRPTSSMKRFSEILEEFNLWDLPLIRGPFTWCRGLNNRFASRLDIFLVSEDWESHFGNILLIALPKPVSDHFPMLLDSGGTRRGRTFFRSENVWLKEKGFLKQVKTWTSYMVRGSFSYILAWKLKELKKDLKVWLRVVSVRKEEAM